MKDKAPHVFAGWTLGFVCYAMYLFCFVLFGPSPSAIWMMPFPNSLSATSSVPLFSKLQDLVLKLWDFHRGDFVVVLTGLLLPIGFAARAWSRPNSQRTLLWRRWGILLILAGVNLVARALIAHCIYFLLPLHSLWLW